MKFILFSLLFLQSFNLLIGQPGNLISTFGTHGVIHRDINPDTNDAITNVLELADGSILVTGFTRAFGQPDGGNSLVSKYDVDGTLLWDVLFDGSSQGLKDYIHASITSENFFYTCTVYEDESFGDIRISLKVRKWNIDGSLDISFGENGETIITRADIDMEIYDMKIDASNRIYLVGATNRSNSTDQDALVIRLNPDGSIDDNYAVNGYFIKNWNGEQTKLKEGLVLKEALYLVGFNDSSIPNKRPVFAKLTETGMLDNRFGDSGRVVFDNNFIDANSIAKQGANHIILAGPYENDNDIGVIRFDLYGNVDNTFGQDGLTILDFSNHEKQADLIINDDNSIYIGGYMNVPLDISLIHLTPDGIINESFANNGIALFDVNGHDFLTAMVLLQDGNIIMCGLNESKSPNDLIILKAR